MVNPESDVGVDLSGGYYDAGDNVKFNFPIAGSMALIARLGFGFGEGTKKADQWRSLS